MHIKKVIANQYTQHRFYIYDERDVIVSGPYDSRAEALRNLQEAEKEQRNELENVNRFQQENN